jgi:SAM-dependent methyltransferase
MTASNDDIEIARWEEQAAERLLGATYEQRLRLYSEIYDHDNALWLGRHGRTGISGACARNRELLHLACPGDGPVLDIGGGLGVAGDAFAPSREYVVCDVSPPVCAHSGCGDTKRRTVAALATELPFPDASFDAVLMLDVLEHLHSEDIERSMMQVRRVIRPRGRLLIAMPNRISGPWDCRRNLPDPHHHKGLHLNEMSVGDMLRLVRRHGFSALAFQTGHSRSKLVSMPPLTLWAALWEGIAGCVPWRHRVRLCSLAVVLANKPAR